MAECCSPFRCKFVDGLLAVFFVCSAVGAGILLCIMYLDRETTKGHCLVLNVTGSISGIEVPDSFNQIVCDALKIITVAEIVIPISLIILTWICGFSSFIGWWILQTIIISLETIIALAVGVALTTTVLLYCGQLFASVGNVSSCISAASIYDSRHASKNAEKTELILEHVIVAVAASWFTFLSCLFSACTLLILSCVKHYQSKVEKLHQIAQDLRLAILLEESRTEARQQRQQDVNRNFDPPPAYVADQADHMPRGFVTEETPLIQF